jgi:hypothetical protein
MPWQQLGGANAGLPGNAIDATIHWLGTRDNDPLIIRTENGPLGPNNTPNPAAEVMRITPADPAVLAGALPRSVGIGTRTPRRKLHVEPSEIHTGGSGAGFSFGNRLDLSTGQPSPFTENPPSGQRWVWYATGGAARLWSGTDKIEVSTVGSLSAQGTLSSRKDVTALGAVTAEGAIVGDRVNAFADVIAGGDVNVVGDVNATHGRFGTSSGTAVLGTSSSGAGVMGTGGSSGVVGISPTQVGVFGRSSAGLAGVQGSSSSGTGVDGVSNTGTGVDGLSNTGAGVRGTCGTPSTTISSGVGVFGSGPEAGIKGESGEAGVHGVGLGLGGMGVFGHARDAGIGVLGQSVNGIAVRGVKANGLGTAAEFVGRVHVSGFLEKSGGGFKIDHPLAPADMYLNHSFVESSEMKNVYDGVAPLDENGAAWVDLPEWFEALNGDFRYQLTAVGGPAPNLHVAEELSENRFKIAGGEDGMKVCWQLTGTRKDRWAAANPLEVEQEKREEERGRYVEPSLYDAPEEQRVMRGLIAEAVEEEQRPPQPSGIDFARLEEERLWQKMGQQPAPPPQLPSLALARLEEAHRRQIDESRRLLEEQRRETGELRRRIERQDEAPPESMQQS